VRSRKCVRRPSGVSLFLFRHCNMIMDHLHAYGILLCLHTLTSTCLLTHVVSSLTPEINYYRFGYYLPDSYHMHFTDYYFTAVKITDTQSSGIPKLRHTFKYINCSTSMYFVSLNIDLDSPTSFDLSHPLKS
jgi:hypothetical protein